MFALICTIFVFWWQQTNEGTERFSQLGEIQVVTPAGHCAEFTGVVARQRLFVTLEHFGDVDHLADINVWQYLHQVLKSWWLRLRFNIFLVHTFYKIKLERVLK